jgi:hypothetical protein
MAQRPSFIAYAVTDRPGRKPVWRRIGVAFRSEQGLAVTLNALPLGGRVVLFEPKPGIRGTAQFFPAAMPGDLATRPALRGENIVWLALRRTRFPPGTRIFYNRSPKGCRRRADMLILIPGRGIIAVEVKGGLVRYRNGFRQRLAGSGRGAERWHKRIAPWQQAGRAVAHALAALRINPVAVPQAFVAVLPATHRDALPFAPPPHLLTSEDLRPASLAAKITALLPPLDPAASAQLAAAMDRIAAALARPSDEGSPGTPPQS